MQFSDGRRNFDPGARCAFSSCIDPCETAWIIHASKCETYDSVLAVRSEASPINMEGAVIIPLHLVPHPVRSSDARPCL